MENFRCTEFLTESPSTSSAPGRFGGITATTIAPPATSAPPPIVTRSLNSASTSAPSSRQQQQQQTQQLRRRATKSDIGLRQSSPNDVMKLLLGQ
ncbi:hypothetical protein WUBG_18904, partial [Wuchereria bancrofti]